MWGSRWYKVFYRIFENLTSSFKSLFVICLLCLFVSVLEPSRKSQDWCARGFPGLDVYFRVISLLSNPINLSLSSTGGKHSYFSIFWRDFSPDVITILLAWWGTIQIFKNGESTGYHKKFILGGQVDLFYINQSWRKQCRALDHIHLSRLRCVLDSITYTWVALLVYFTRSHTLQHLHARLHFRKEIKLIRL